MIYFGTDGIRGEAKELFTVNFLNQLGTSVSILCNEQNFQKVCIGQDPRISSYYIVNILSGVLIDKGIDVENLGVISTPVISHTLVNNKDIKLGIMISASHNPYEDNGIKIFGQDGKKLEEKYEEAIENNIILEKTNSSYNYGRLKYSKYYLNEYVDFVTSFGVDLQGKNIVLDLANGSASNIAGNIFKKLGANVIELNNKPDGYNINVNSGSTNIDVLSNYMKENNNVDFGFAYDGDADRVILVNLKGEVLDGDYIIYLLAKYLKEIGKLKDNGVVITSMTNYAFRDLFDKLGIKMIESDVGDKYVIRALDNNNLSLGGEQSGHIILPDYLPTGDGILISVVLSMIIVNKNIDLVFEFENIHKYPQKIVNVKVNDKETVINNQELIDEVKSINKSIRGSGRVIVRASGTEDLVRIMVEHINKATCDEICDIIKKKIKDL